MKPKILLAKYLDWAVLAILGVVLIIVAIKAFPLRAAGEGQLKEDISQYDQAVQRGMSDTSAQPLPVHDYLSEIRNRLDHAAVLDAYRRNPFLTREDIPYPPLQLRVGIPHTVRFAGTRFTRVIAGDEKLLHVDLAYDLPTGVSTVTFIPLATGETSVRIQTDDDLVHLFKISVRTLITPPPPNPPTEVQVIPSAAVQYKNNFKPAMVLIWFTPTNPDQISQTVGFSTNAAFYRKPAGASDAEYVRLDDPDDPPVPLNRDQIHDVMLKFQPPEMPGGTGPGTTTGTTAPGAPATTAPSPAISVSAAPPVPEAVTEIRPPTTLTGAGQTSEPPPDSFVFLDQTVDDGESYIYKVVTLSTAADEPDVEPVPCQAPYVTPNPVFLPPVVNFIVRTITPDSASVRITRRDPDTGQWLPWQDFSVGVGKIIGGVRTLKIPLPPEKQIPGIPVKTENKDEDFSTGSILVNTLPNFHVVQYTLKWGPNFTPIYQAKDTRDPQILYLTPRGALHFKSKEK